MTTIVYFLSAGVPVSRHEVTPDQVQEKAREAVKMGFDPYVYRNDGETSTVEKVEISSN
ncbi:MAG: hypothetical protein J0L84_03145 [Verrucomicrobia bacterium]|nr:hypothetical protein [Verrucomicrobiota bacterium]